MISHYFQQQIIEQQESYLIKKAQLLTQQLDVEDLTSQQNKNVLKEFVHQSNERITLLDSNGKVLFDTTDQSLDQRGNDRPEIKAVLNGGTLGTSLRMSTTLNEELLYVALPIKVKEALRSNYSNRRTNEWLLTSNRKLSSVGLFFS